MMSANRWIAQVYGYAVCLICVVVFLIALAGIIGSAFDLTDPIRVQARGSATFGPSLPLTSFKAYSAAARRQAANAPISRSSNGTEMPQTLIEFSDEALRQNFNSEREDRIGTVRFNAMRQLVTSIVFVILTAVLFLLHWRWLRRADTLEVTP